MARRAGCSALVMAALLSAVWAQAAGGGGIETGAAAAALPMGVFEVPRGDARIDPTRSRAGFSVRMRWFARVDGVFGAFRGQVADLGGDARRVEVELDSASLDVGGRTRMTEWASSDEFFDVENYPVIVFVSDPFQAGLSIRGGELLGDLSLRGSTRRVAFQMLPTGCSRPGHDCPIIVEGRVSRAEFGMDAHRVAVQDAVDLRFEVMLARRGSRP